MRMRLPASTTTASAAMLGRMSRILPSSISTSACAKSPSWRSSVSTMPPLSRMRRAPCRRARSASAWAAAEWGVAEAAATSAAPAFRMRRREGLLLERCIVSSLRFWLHHRAAGPMQQVADIHWPASGVDWRDQGDMAMAYATRLHSTLLLLLATMATSAFGQAVEPVRSLAAREKPALLETLKALTSIESGSRDIEGLGRIADLIAARLRELGGQVELVEASNIYKMEDTPAQIGKMVRATFTGTGDKKILLIAHMDTVYQRGTLEKQPFRIEGDRAYGLGISDDKQGIALILHTVSMLKALDFRAFGTLTVLINADEELSSPGSRSLLTKLGGEHDATFSAESSRVESDKLSLA